MKVKLHRKYVTAFDKRYILNDNDLIQEKDHLISFSAKIGDNEYTSDVLRIPQPKNFKKVHDIGLKMFIKSVEKHESNS